MMNSSSHSTINSLLNKNKDYGVIDVLDFDN